MVTFSPQWVTVLLQFTVTIFGNRFIKCLIIWPAGLNKAYICAYKRGDWT